MFASRQLAVKNYTLVSVETDIANADPHKLILMLFEGALLAIAKARLSMLGNDIAAKGEAISQAIAIIDQGLKASLDVATVGDLATKLYALYEYMCRRLLAANLNNQPEILDEVAKLLRELNDAWREIKATGKKPVRPAVKLYRV